MSIAQKFCRCCYASEALKTMGSRELNVYRLICNTEALEDEDCLITTCLQCCEFLEKVLCFKFECSAVDDIFSKELDVKHQRVESILNDAVDEVSSQFDIKTEVTDLKTSQTFPESQLVSDKVKWESLVENSLLIESCDSKKRHRDQQSKSKITTQNLVDFKKKSSSEKCANFDFVKVKKQSVVLEKNHSIDCDRPFKCNECPHKTKTNKLLKQHITNMHCNDKPFSCDRCNYSAKRKKDLKVHEMIHRDVTEYPFKCNECSYKTATKGSLIRHIARRHSNVKPFNCDRCNYSAKTKEDLTSHKWVHVDAVLKPYKCNECSFETKTNKSLKSHIACRHSDDKLFSCNRCDYSGKTKGYLREHKTVHMNVTQKPYECNECSFKTITKKLLKRHITSKHSDEKPFSCDRCNYSTKTKQHLKAHKWVHLDVSIKPYKCNECSYKTITKSSLRRHIAFRHRNDKPFTCDRCNFSAKTKEYLNRHERTHTI